VRFPATAPMSVRPRTSQCSRVSKTQPAWGSTRAACQFHFWGRGRQAMHLPCKQVDVGALPTDSTRFNRGKLDQSTERSLINFVRWVRLPLPQPILGEVIRLPDCKSGVAKQSRKRRTGALPALPIISLS
jgi:hypothetical protein